MTIKTSKWFALLGGLALTVASHVHAQDSGALLDALVRKGILNDQEAEDIRADLTRDSHASVIGSISGGKSTTSLAISGRMQLQYVNFDNSNTADTAGFMLRRLYLGAKANVGSNWIADFNYNFADSTFDKAYMEWNGDLYGQPLALDIGLRKVNFGYEETTSSGSLKAIERSPVTRYFVESGSASKGLGAGSYHLGVYAEGNPLARKGKTDGVFYGVAITNPQRQDGSTTGNTVGASPSASNNTPALWADVGYSYVDENVQGKVGVAFSRITDSANFGQGLSSSVLTGQSLYGDLTVGHFNFAGEFLAAQITDGIAAGSDQNVYGFWVQPSYMLTDKIEVVGRYSYLDTDKNTASLKELVRRSGVGTAGQKFTEYYAGLNYLFSGRDVLWQIGFITAESENSAGATQDVTGLRTQFQVNF